MSTCFSKKIMFIQFTAPILLEKRTNFTMEFLNQSGFANDNGARDRGMFFDIIIVCKEIKTKIAAWKKAVRFAVLRLQESEGLKFIAR